MRRKERSVAEVYGGTAPAEIGPGSRVRYKWTHRMAGTVIKEYQYRGVKQYLVRWEDRSERPAYKENLEVLDEK